MKIQDLNNPAAATAPAPEVAAGADDRGATEMALLRAQVEHLELVVETARSLMTSNQERLLRRLHDLPHEMAVLAARLDRLGGPASGAERIRASLRRVV